MENLAFFICPANRTKIPDTILVTEDINEADQLLIDQGAVSLAEAKNIIAAWPKEKSKVLLLTSGTEDDPWIRLFLAHGYANILRGGNVTKANISYRLKNPAGIQALDESLSCKEQHYQEPKEENTALGDDQKIQVFWSGSGRTGTTSLAIMEALALAKIGKEVLLLDLYEPAPAMCDYLSVKISTDPFELINLLTEDNLTIEKANDYLIKTNGITLFPGFNFSSYRYFNIDHCLSLINLYQTQYKNIVIDCGSGLIYSSTYAAMQMATDIQVVTIPDRRLLDYQQKQIDFVQKRWRPKAKFSFIINHPNTNHENVSRDELQAFYPHARHVPQQKDIAQKNFAAAIGRRA